MFIVDRHMIGPLDGVCWFFPERSTVRYLLSNRSGNSYN